MEAINTVIANDLKSTSSASFMEGTESSEYDKNTQTGLHNTLDNQMGNRTVIGIERETQNNLITTDHSEDNQPSCSWKDVGSKSHFLIRREASSLVSAIIDRASEVSAGSGIACADNIIGKECHNHLHIFEHQDRTHPLHREQIPNISCSSIVNHERLNNLELPNVPLSNNSLLMCSENNPQVLPTSVGREIPTVNIPNASTARALQEQSPRRTNNVQGPPPSYSKCLLDRRINSCGSTQFVSPIPPPSYDGTHNELRILGHSSFTMRIGSKAKIFFSRVYTDLAVPAAACILPSLRESLYDTSRYPYLQSSPHHCYGHVPASMLAVLPVAILSQFL